MRKLKSEGDLIKIGVSLTGLGIDNDLLGWSSKSDRPVANLLIVWAIRANGVGGQLYHETGSLQ